jgi:hypothetical protein
MNAEEFDAAVERDRQQQPIVAAALADARERPATGDEVRAFEQRFGCVLPASYRHFATHYGCGDFIFATILSPLPDSEFYIGHATHALRPEFLPISDNHCGDYYGFPCDAGICRDSIVFADHEQNYESKPTDYEDFFTFLVAQGLNHE